MPDDLQGCRHFCQLRLRLEKRLAGDDSLLVERGLLVDQFAGQIDLDLGLQQFKLKRLQRRADQPGKFLPWHHRFAGPNQYTVDLARHQRRDHRLRIPRQFDSRVDRNSTVDIAEFDLRGCQTDCLAGFVREHDGIAGDRHTLGRQRRMVLMRYCPIGHGPDGSGRQHRHRKGANHRKAVLP